MGGLGGSLPSRICAADGNERAKQRAPTRTRQKLSDRFIRCKFPLRWIISEIATRSGWTRESKSEVNSTIDSVYVANEGSERLDVLRNDW